jgi:hypothetical protein
VASQNSLVGSYQNVLALNAATTGGNSSPVDLSAFGAGAFYVVTSAFGGGWTPTLQVSPDGGTTWLTPGTNEIANFAAVVANGAQRYPLLLPTVFLGLARILYTIVSGSVTANVYFAGRHA